MELMDGILGTLLVNGLLMIPLVFFIHKALLLFKIIPKKQTTFVDFKIKRNS